MGEIRSRTGNLTWLASVNSLPSINILTHIFDSLVTSLTTSKLVLVRVRECELLKLDLPKAELARMVLGVHKYTSRWALYHDLDWPSMHASLIRAMLLHLGRLFRTKYEDNPVISKMVLTRANQVQEGDRGGLLGDLFVIIQQVGSQPDELWLAKGRSLSKNLWKKQVDLFICKLNKFLFDRWCDKDKKQQRWIKLTGYDNDVEDYTSLPLNQRSMLASVRLSVTRAAGDIPAKMVPRGTESCRLCLKRTEESIQHLVLECSRFDEARTLLWCPERVPQLYPEEMWRCFLRLNKNKLITFLFKLNAAFVNELGHPLFFTPSQARGDENFLQHFPDGAKAGREKQCT